MNIYQELLYCAAFPTCQLIGLLALGWVFRVDRVVKNPLTTDKREGGGR